MKTPSRRSRSLLFPAFVLVLLATGALWFFFNRDTPPPQSAPFSEQRQPEPSSSLAPQASETPPPPSASTPLPVGEPAPEPPGQIKEQAPSGPSLALPGKDQLPLAVETIRAFYHSLDQQGYIRGHHLDAASPIYFTRLIQKVLDNPPIAIRETDDLLTILKNSAHFFRILGKDNIFLIKEVLSQEKDRMEEVMANYSLLLGQPESLGNDLSLKIPEGSLYEYACFFLNTMGGRLYLSRRDSRTRMLVTYYALLIIDQANIQGNNKYGLQLQPAIDMLTAEIETGGSHLQYKTAYLETLYDLKEKYQ